MKKIPVKVIAKILGGDLKRPKPLKVNAATGAKSASSDRKVLKADHTVDKPLEVEVKTHKVEVSGQERQYFAYYEKKHLDVFLEGLPRPSPLDPEGSRYLVEAAAVHELLAKMIHMNLADTAKLVDSLELDFRSTFTDHKGIADLVDVVYATGRLLEDLRSNEDLTTWALSKGVEETTLLTEVLAFVALKEIVESAAIADETSLDTTKSTEASYTLADETQLEILPLYEDLSALAESFERVFDAFREFTETVPLSDHIDWLLEKTPEESLATDDSSVLFSILPEYREALAAQEALVVDLQMVLSDSFGLLEYFKIGPPEWLAYVENRAASDVVTLTFNATRTFNETLSRLEDLMWGMTKVVTDTKARAEVVGIAAGKPINDSKAYSESFTLQTALSQLESLSRDDIVSLLFTKPATDTMTRTEIVEINSGKVLTSPNRTTAEVVTKQVSPGIEETLVCNNLLVFSSTTFLFDTAALNEAVAVNFSTGFTETITLGDIASIEMATIFADSVGKTSGGYLVYDTYWNPLDYGAGGYVGDILATFT